MQSPESLTFPADILTNAGLRKALCKDFALGAKNTEEAAQEFQEMDMGEFY